MLHEKVDEKECVFLKVIDVKLSLKRWRLDRNSNVFLINQNQGNYSDVGIILQKVLDVINSSLNDHTRTLINSYGKKPSDLIK